MSVLPPCESVLQLHGKRANFLAVNWKKVTTSHFQFPDAVHHDWNRDKSFLWAIDTFPEDIESIMLDSRYNSEDVNDVLGDSGDKELPGE